MFTTLTDKSDDEMEDVTVDSESLKRYTVRAESATTLTNASKTPESITEIVQLSDTAAAPLEGVAENE